MAGKAATWWRRAIDWLQSPQVRVSHTYTFSRELTPEEMEEVQEHVDTAFASMRQAFDAMERAGKR